MSEKRRLMLPEERGMRQDAILHATEAASWRDAREAQQRATQRS